MICLPYTIVQKNISIHAHTTEIQIQNTAVYIALECIVTSKFMNKHCILSELHEII